MHAQTLAALDWYVAMGVDETLSDSPVDWPALVAAKAVATQPLPRMTAPAAAAPLPPTASPQMGMQEVATLAATAESLDALEAAIKAYKGLAICRTATQPVFAEGVAGSPLLVIGEAPGAEEDRRGAPFCGPSGQLLDKMLVAIGFSRQRNCTITNSLYWRPPGNRTPSTDEILTCRPFLLRHIELLQPKVVLLTGGVAVRALLQDDSSLSKLRGKTLSYNDIPVIATYHPSYLLRQPAQKKLAWQDMLALKGHLDSLV